MILNDSIIAPLKQDVKKKRKLELKISIFVGHGQPPVFSYGAVGDLYAGRALSSFIFIPVNHINHFFNHIFLESHLGNISNLFVLLNIGLKNRIENRVGGKRILILLIWPQFRRRGFDKNIFWDT